MAQRFDLSAIAGDLAAASLIRTLPAALRACRSVVVQAPPGAGKTTLVPPVLAELIAARGGSGRVVVTQPRRIAARAAARRLAALTGTEVGDLVGYAVRGDRRGGDATRVEFVTNGLFVRRLLADPDLAGVAAVVLDEVHERSLAGDLAFAMAREVAELRENLLVVAMSATLDAARWAQLLGSLGVEGGPAGSGETAPVLTIASEPHPLHVTWAPPPPGVARVDARGVPPAFLEHVVRVSAAELRQTPEGSALVFVPGVREIDRVVEGLRALNPQDAAGQPVDVLSLHGRLPAAAQDAALREGPRRRIVVATDVAESSLTVPGVRLVIDAGLAREPRLDVARGATRLVTVPVSRASAQQRAGRAARLGPGRVVRCLAQGEWDRLRPDRTPELATVDLTSAALLLASWGAPGGAGLALPDPPPTAALTAAVTTLTSLGAVDGAGQPTPLGRALARIPADPREARALLAAGALSGDRPGLRRVAEAVAVLTCDERAPGADLTALWHRLRADRGPAGARWRDDADRFEKLARTQPATPGGGRLTAPDGVRGVGGQSPRPGPSDELAGLSDEDLLGLVVALAHPGRIARLREGSRAAYLLADGHGATLPDASPLTGQEWLAIGELGASGGGASLIRGAAPLSRALAERAGAPLLTIREEAEWTGRRVAGRQVEALGAIDLVRREVVPDPATARDVVAGMLAGRGLEVFTWSAAADGLRRRLGLLRRVLGQPWPDVSTSALLAAAGHWLGPELDDLARGADPAGVSMTRALQRVLPWPAAAHLDTLAPERIEVPTGSRIRLSYPHPDDPDGRVVLAVKLQECFGLEQAPRVADGREAVQLHLLSPAGRPLAVTEDLASFWRQVYPQVRAENRGRYPRHPWPEDPLTAPPRRGTKRSGR